MGWERRGAHKYFYSSAWVDGKVVKKYVGRGKKAAHAEQELLEREAERQYINAGGQRWAIEMAEVDKPIKKMRELAKQIMEADLLANNFYRAGRVWRKRKRNFQ